MDRNHKRRKISFIITSHFSIAIIILFSACFRQKENSFGVAFNYVRIELGLPVLDSTWLYNKSYTDEGGKWINPTKEINTPYHSSKVVFCKNRKILWESNEYVGLKSHVTIDGTAKERLFITYNFIDKKWEYTFETIKETTEKQYYSTNISLSKQEADSILVSWKIGGNVPNRELSK